MVDNVTITPGAGATVAADDVAGVLYQRIKLAIGADGVANDVNAGAGAVATGTLRTTLASDDPAVIKLNSILTELQTQSTSVPHEALDLTTDLTHAFVTSAASGEVDLVTAGAGAVTIRLHRMTITAAAATVVEIRDGAVGAALKTVEFPAAGAYVFDFSARPYAKSSAATKLVRNSTVATKVTVDFEYVKN